MSRRQAPEQSEVFGGGRRYEQFDKRQQFDEFADHSWKAIESVAPIVEKYRIPLAIENHKDWLIPHMLKMLKCIDSEYVDVCIDTTNSFSLLEDENVKKCLRYEAKYLNL